MSAERALLAFVVLMVGLFVYGRWTGSSLDLSLTGQNPLGLGISQAAQAAEAARSARVVKTGSDAAHLVQQPGTQSA